MCIMCTIFALISKTDLLLVSQNIKVFKAFSHADIAMRIFKNQETKKMQQVEQYINYKIHVVSIVNITAKLDNQLKTK